MRQDELHEIEAALAAAGLPLLACVHRDSAQGVGGDAIAQWLAERPWVRSLVLAFHVGDSVWKRLVHEPRYRDHRHAFDSYSEAVLAAAARRFVARGHQASAWHSSDPAVLALPLMRLAVAARVGWVGRHGLLLHPEFGSWIAVRGVLATSFPWHQSPRALPPRPCDDCPAPCLTACRGDAFSRGTWDAAACHATRSRDSACHLACPTRDACPVGVDYRYPAAQMAHHATASFVTMDALLGSRPGIVARAS